MKRRTICWTYRSRIAGLAFLASLLVCLLFVRDSASAQHPKPTIEHQLITNTSASPDIAPHAADIRVNSDLVLVPVTVFDGSDHLVSGLAKDHFRLYEDKVEQVITHFFFQDLPISVGFVFDASKSMAGKLTRSREAVTRFLNTANPEDEFFLVQFNDQVELALGMTKDTEALQNRLMLIKPKGGTALLDAIYLSMQQIKQAHNLSKALIVISDGGDNFSRYTVSDLKRLTREADVQIYAIGIFEPIKIRTRSPEELDGPNLLAEICEQNGGRLFEIANLNELPEVASRIGEALRNQYVLGYSPVNPRHDGKYHRLQVRLEPTKGSPKLHAYHRQAYYSPLE